VSQVFTETQDGIKLEVKLKASSSSSTVKIQVCKVGGNFSSDSSVKVDFGNSGPDYFYSSWTNIGNTDCTTEKSLTSNTSNKNEGYNLDSDIKIVAPSKCFSNWDSHCEKKPAPGCGFCWWSVYGLPSMYRTCKGQ